MLRGVLGGVRDVTGAEPGEAWSGLPAQVTGMRNQVRELGSPRTPKTQQEARFPKHGVAVAGSRRVRPREREQGLTLYT